MESTGAPESQVSADGAAPHADLRADLRPRSPDRQNILNDVQSCTPDPHGPALPNPVMRTAWAGWAAQTCRPLAGLPSSRPVFILFVSIRVDIEQQMNAMWISSAFARNASAIENIHLKQHGKDWKTKI